MYPQTMSPSGALLSLRSKFKAMFPPLLTLENCWATSRARPTAADWFGDPRSWPRSSSCVAPARAAASAAFCSSFCTTQMYPTSTAKATMPSRTTNSRATIGTTAPARGAAERRITAGSRVRSQVRRAETGRLAPVNDSGRSRRGSASGHPRRGTAARTELGWRFVGRAPGPPPGRRINLPKVTDMVMTTDQAAPRRPAARVSRRDRRRGAAAVEFAVVASLLFLLVFGIIEIGRAMMVMEMLNNGARNGARVGTLAGSSNTDVTNAVNSALASGGFSGTTTAIQVNGQAGNVNSAAPGDSITVTVQVPYNNVTWLPASMFLAGRTLSSTVVMRHE